MKVLRKIISKTKIDRMTSQQIRESGVGLSNILMSGWKKEENGTNM